MTLPSDSRQADGRQAPLAHRAEAAAPGHFDELRGAPAPCPPGRLAPAWDRFLQTLAPTGPDDLDRRRARLAQQVHDNGVTYNIYADAQGPQRPWSLDLFPLIVTADSWRRIEAGVLQRMALLEAVMADVYGPQRLVAGNLLPPALVHGHPGYLRALHGALPAGGRHLHLAAFDLARDPNGGWWVVSQRTQAPSGLGYLLENRQLISHEFAQAFEDLGVRPLAAAYRDLLEGLRALSPARGDEPRIALLTPGPYNETYFEHAFLARHLGLTLVEGNDLTVRDERLFLKTLRGLEPVHGLLKRLDDEFLDPLELRADSQLGVPGLLQAVRAGNVLVANAPGSAFLESPGLLGFLPALAQQLLGQELVLPSLATWWCGERAALEAVLPQLGSHVIKSTYASPGADAVLGPALTRAQREEWTDRLRHRPDDYTVQAYLPLSQLPTWSAGCITPRSLLLRVFALPGPAGGWRVLPGGLTRLAGGARDLASMQRGGSSADTWVLGRSDIDRAPLRPARPGGTTAATHPPQALTSRAAENLFWLGRYTERAQNTARLAQVMLASLQVRPAPAGLLAWVDAMAVDHGLVPAGMAPASLAGQAFAQAVLAVLADTDDPAGIGFILARLQQAAFSVRERLAPEHGSLIERTEQEFLEGCARWTGGEVPDLQDAVRVLQALCARLDALDGTGTGRMAPDEGVRLMSAGRHLERLGFLAGALARGIETQALGEASGSEALLALFEGASPSRDVRPQHLELPAVVERLVLDTESSRSLAWVVRALRAELAGVPAGLDSDLPDLQTPARERLCETDGDRRCPQLLALLEDCVGAVRRLSDTLAARCFNHAEDARQSLGA